MDEKTLQENEYSRHFYGFSSQELTDDVADLMKNCINRTLSEISKTILEKHSDQNLVECQISQLRNLYLTKLNEGLEKFRDTTAEIFKIPPNVAFDNWKHDCTDEEVSRLQKEVESLEKEFLREKLFLIRCKEEKAHIEKLKPLYEATNAKLKAVPKLVSISEHLEKTVFLQQKREDYKDYLFDENFKCEQEDEFTRME